MAGATVGASSGGESDSGKERDNLHHHDQTNFASGIGVRSGKICYVAGSFSWMGKWKYSSNGKKTYAFLNSKSAKRVMEDWHKRTGANDRVILKPKRWVVVASFAVRSMVILMKV